MLLNTDEGNGCLYAIALFYRPKNLPLEPFLAFGKQLTMIIQFSKHIMLLAFFFFRKDKRTYEKQQPQLLGIRKWEPNGIVGQLRHINIRGKKEIYVQSCEAKEK